MSEPRTYTPRTAENVLRAELASVNMSIEHQQRRLDSAHETITDARALRQAHLVSRGNVLDAMRALGIDPEHDSSGDREVRG